MDSGLVVVDATSDDEFGVDDWLSVKEEENGNSSVEENCDSLRPKGDALKDDEDDDCVILDGDPDKLVVGVDDRRDRGDGPGDLCIVGQKGQVACRDFPHSRHLCANFPFSTTSHAEHCNLCHCFVCDSLAPCIYWGDGVSPTDHCHATDKDEGWKAQRNSFKKTNTATLPPKHQLQHIPNLQATIIAQARPQAPPVSIQPLNASSQSIHHNLAKTLNYQNRLPQPVKRVNSGGSALAPTSHTQFKRASMTQILKTVSHTNQVCEALPQRPQHLAPAPLASQQLPVVLPRTQHMQVQTASSTSQMRRIMPQRHQHLPQAPIVSQQLPVVSPRTQHMKVRMFSSTNQVQGAPAQIPQHLPRAPHASQLPPVALARTHHMRVQTVSSTNQMHTTLPQTPQHRHRASLASQQQHVMLPRRTQSIPVTAQISQCTTAASQRTSQRSQNIPVAPQITSQASQHSTAASSDEDNIRKFQNILAAMAAELGVPYSIDQSTTDSNQAITMHSDLHMATISSNPTVLGNNAVVSEDIHLNIFLPVRRREAGL